MNPYINARREWNERYGSYISAMKTWRAIAIISLFVAATAVLAAVWLASQSKRVPYIVETNKGEIVQVYQSVHGKKQDVRVVKFQIASFIKDLRGVTSDPVVQAEQVRRVYAHMNDRLPAYRSVSTWYRANTPFEKAKKEGTTIVEVQQVLSLSDNTWRVEWTEVVRLPSGVDQKAVKMTGTIQVIEGAEVNSTTVQYNPIGMLIKELEWSRGFVATS